LWPATFGLACCAIEMMNTVCAVTICQIRRGNISRFAAPSRRDDCLRACLQKNGAGSAPHL
jgi:NADH:ubiquinone oxidoreductase subunit B-like Fe-S oxidoreductase